MQIRKGIAGFLIVTSLSFSAITAHGASIESIKPINTIEVNRGSIPTSGNQNLEKQIYFKSFTGTVKEINEHRSVEGTKILSVENEAGQKANLIISKDTYIVDNIKITEGSVVKGFYDANAPMIMIYPPQYNTEVVAVIEKNQNIKVDRFNEDLVSADNLLKLNISNDTEIISKDGKVFDGELANRKLVVIYEVSTRSIPAQTNPTKIVVLSEKDGLDAEIPNMDIIVDNQKIEAPAAYTNDHGTVMVPLRPIAEALGFSVQWDNESQSIMIGKGISLKIGQDNYNYMKTKAIELGAAPELVDGRTFVPLTFFKKVARMNNAYVFENQIVIDNGEPMN